MKVKLVLSLVLLLALVLLVPLAGCGSDTGTQESASADEQAVIEKCLATPPNDREAQATLWTKDAVLEDYLSNVTSEGRDQILDYLVNQDATSHFETMGDSVKVGDYVIQPTVLILADGSPLGYGAHVFKITGDGLIEYLAISGAGVEE